MESNVSEKNKDRGRNGIHVVRVIFGPFCWRAWLPSLFGDVYAARTERRTLRRQNKKERMWGEEKYILFLFVTSPFIHPRSLDREIKMGSKVRTASLHAHLAQSDLENSPSREQKAIHIIFLSALFSLSQRHTFFCLRQPWMNPDVCVLAPSLGSVF